MRFVKPFEDFLLSHSSTTWTITTATTITTKIRKDVTLGDVHFRVHHNFATANSSIRCHNIINNITTITMIITMDPITTTSTTTNTTRNTGPSATMLAKIVNKTLFSI
jgi:hypothetical protein